MCNDFDQHDDEELWIKWLFILMGSEDPISTRTFRKWGLSSIIMDSYKSSPPLTTFPSWWFSSHSPGRLLLLQDFFSRLEISMKLDPICHYLELIWKPYWTKHLKLGRLFKLVLGSIVSLGATSFFLWLDGALVKKITNFPKLR